MAVGRSQTTMGTAIGNVSVSNRSFEMGSSRKIRYRYKGRISSFPFLGFATLQLSVGNKFNLVQE